MRRLWLLMALVVAVPAVARVPRPLVSRAPMPDARMVRVLPLAVLPKGAIVPPIPGKPAAVFDMAKPDAHAVAPPHAETPQWVPQTSEQRWQQYSYP